nr:ABC transporter ATP-binding protein [Nocardioides panaciterrulae]
MCFAVGGARILDQVELSVPAGEFLGVIGPNGAGKTTLFNCVSGLVSPTGGSIRVDGHDLTHAPVHQRARRGVGRTFQTSSVFPALSALENVRLAVQAHSGGSLRLWGSTRGSVRRAAECLDQVRLGRRAEHPAGSLSHGDKRKLELAIVLATEPRLLLLDEPMAGLGVEDVPELVAVIRDLHRGHGITVLMVEHHIEVVLGLADRVAVLHHGRMVGVDTPSAVMEDPLVQSAYLGEAL